MSPFILQFPNNQIPLHFQSEGTSFPCLFQSWSQATEKHTSPDGGIGRRAGLKHQWSNPCRFDPGSGYPLNRKSLIFKDLRFFFWFLHHICTTRNSQIVGVLPGIACTFIGKLLSAPSFFGVSRAVSLCFCTRSVGESVRNTNHSQ